MALRAAAAVCSRSTGSSSSSCRKSQPAEAFLLQQRWRATEDATRERIVLTAARLDQLLESEITQLSMRESNMLSMHSVLSFKQCPKELARLLHEDLPVRLAKRVEMLQSLPGWRDKDSITYVRHLYMRSFKELRLADPEHPDEFLAYLKQIKKRHLHTHHLITGLKAYSMGMKEDEVNEWLDKFFELRVSTNMLIAHYLRVAQGEDKSLPAFDGDVNPYQSTVNEHCNPCAIVRISVPIIKRMCMNRYGVAPEIQLQDVGAQPLSFVPRYLFYILSELLKNSARATIERHGDSRRTPPIEVLVSGDEHGASIRIRDQGGGIPKSEMERVWSYLYSTAEPISEPLTRAAVEDPTDVTRLQQLVEGPESESALADPVFDGLPPMKGLSSFSDTVDLAGIAGSPIAGLGCGLPLSRLYARYLGGKIEMQTLPGYGTDVFVYLCRFSGMADDLPII
jgi:pyruvate dehydrogenase kinase 2/3/4